MLFFLPDLPDPSLRQPATLATVAPVCLSIYAQAVLAILPNTFILKLPLLPFIVWQAWRCAMGVDFAMGLANWLGVENDGQLAVWNSVFAAAMLVMASRSFEWTFIIKKPLRKYEWPEGQDSPVERPLSIANVHLDALDLFFNQRGLAWSWSSFPCPRDDTPQPSIASVWANTLLKFMVLDISHHVLYLMCPSIDQAGSSFFDATLPFVPRTILAMLAAFLGGVYIYARMETTYQAATLIGRILLRQPASHWPPFLREPWKATSIRDFWSVRWHPFFRHFFIVFGSRPGGALLGWPGAVMGAFTLSGLLHILVQWATGHGTVWRHNGGYFVIMGVGMVLESKFERVTGTPVRGWYGWLWTMTWLLSWGSFAFDSWAQRGNLAVDFFPDHLRPGKFLIDGAISFFSKRR